MTNKTHSRKFSSNNLVSIDEEIKEKIEDAIEEIEEDG